MCGSKLEQISGGGVEVIIVCILIKNVSNKLFKLLHCFMHHFQSVEPFNKKIARQQKNDFVNCIVVFAVLYNRNIAQSYFLLYFVTTNISF